MKTLSIFTFCVFVSLNGFSQSNVEETDTTEVFIKVEKEAGFPGGDSAWAKFVSENLRYPKAARKKKIEGTVTVKFIVDKNGNILDAMAISGPEELRREAVRVVKKSPKWLPFHSGGRPATAYRQKEIAFALPRK